VVSDSEFPRVSSRNSFPRITTHTFLGGGGGGGGGEREVTEKGIPLYLMQLTRY